MIVMTGWHSSICAELRKLLPADETVVRAVADAPDFPYEADRYLFAAGVIRPKRHAEQSAKEIRESITVNFHSVERACDVIFDLNPQARVCVIGSESAFTGSYDETYAVAKQRLHAYVTSKRLPYPDQQLVCVAPTIIADSGMTQRRTDQADLEKRAKKNPKGRWLSAAEVAALVHFCLYQDRGYLSGIVIRMNGGVA